MIKNLVANGCSFTEEQGHYVCWPRVVANDLGVEHYTNLAQGGSGNHYISTSTIEYLETQDLDPDQTLILIMWSGISRKDVMISQPWAQHFRRTYCCVPLRHYPVAPGRDDRVWYICSGGQAGSWIDDADAAKFFHPFYKASDPESLCKESLHNFLHLKNYLACEGYQFAFTSFMNLWNPSAVDQGEIEFRIGQFEFSLSRKFDFGPWFFANDQKDGFAEFALEHGDPTINGHPSGQSHERFARDIVIPALERML